MRYLRGAANFPPLFLAIICRLFECTAQIMKVPTKTKGLQNLLLFPRTVKKGLSRDSGSERKPLTTQVDITQRGCNYHSLPPTPTRLHWTLFWGFLQCKQGGWQVCVQRVWRNGGGGAPAWLNLLQITRLSRWLVKNPGQQIFLWQREKLKLQPNFPKKEIFFSSVFF